MASRSVWIQLFAGGDQPDAVAEHTSPAPGFSIVDRSGISLALSVDSFDVTISPRSMWRSHTPDHMARRIAEALEVPAVSGGGAPGQEPHRADASLTGSQVLERTMPFSFGDGLLPGLLVPKDPELLTFSQEEKEAVHAWLDTGAIGERAPTAPIRGLSLVLLPPDGVQVGPRWTLAMEPVVALGAEVRREQFGGSTDQDGRERAVPPERWTRRLLDDLVILVGPDRIMEALPEGKRSELVRATPIARREGLRDAVWAELMPTRFRVLARDVDPLRAHALREMLDEEGVSTWQIQLVPRVERRHPTRPGGRPAPPDAELALEQPEDAFLLLGHWGVLDAARADRWARRDREERPHVLPWELAEDPFLAYRNSLVVEPKPWSGIELLCRTELENGPWADVAEDVLGRKYVVRTRHVARDRRRAWKDGVPNYFMGASEATDVPRVVTTLDAHLQEVVHAELGLLMEEHKPAMAMAIAVDIQSGDVLALDSRSAYAYSGFAPLLHVFTPGSTFKAIIMAIALDAGVTTPDSSYETFAKVGGLHLPGRIIREAEGAPDQSHITAAEGLAFSCNAVLVQIALEMSASTLRDRILALGYDSAPGAGLGPERAGRVTPLSKGTWSRNQTHASVGFGHEIGVTLWQHAAALATVLRGGERRSLRLLRSIERDGEAWDLEVERGEQVLSEDACRSIRSMMAMGAEVGTGRHVANAADNPEFAWIGTKTGTTEKVSSELCVHLELEALAKHAREGRRWTRSARAALSQQPKPHGGDSCYTSSMCAAGRVMTDQGPRDVMILVVADDATGRERFGSRVTGPTAMAILRQAFGLPREYGADLADEAASAVEATSPTSGRPALFVPRPSRRGAGANPVRVFDASWISEDIPWSPMPATTVDPELEGGR